MTFKNLSLSNTFGLFFCFSVFSATAFAQNSQVECYEHQVSTVTAEDLLNDPAFLIQRGYTFSQNTYSKEVPNAKGATFVITESSQNLRPTEDSFEASSENCHFNDCWVCKFQVRGLGQRRKIPSGTVLTAVKVVQSLKILDSSRRDEMGQIDIDFNRDHTNLLVNHATCHLNGLGLPSIHHYPLGVPVFDDFSENHRPRLITNEVGAFVYSSLAQKEEPFMSDLHSFAHKNCPDLTRP